VLPRWPLKLIENPRNTTWARIPWRSAVSTPWPTLTKGGGKAAPGRSSISLEHGGAVYHFASDENRQLFTANPDKYEPTHGGWCAYAMSKDIRYAVDPLAFLISEGRLTLFADAEYTEFDGDWVPEQHKLLAAADKNWRRFSGESAGKAAKGSFRLFEEFNLSDVSLAIEGYDPVSYFSEGGSEPRKGKSRWSQSVRGVVYRFASEKNLKLFQRDTAKYEPAHGGWCSYAMGAQGAKVEVDPESYRMTAGQLHLFFKAWYDDTSSSWDEDTKALKKKADANWDKLISKQSERI
jgi:YHS domain-containing protein